jgi:putative ABC transport system substrate-binding protein
LSGPSEAGSVDRRNVAIEYRWAAGQYDRLPALAADLVSLRVAVIFANPIPVALAASTATAIVPVVFAMAASLALSPGLLGECPLLGRKAGVDTRSKRLSSGIGQQGDPHWTAAGSIGCIHRPHSAREILMGRLNCS